MAGEHGCPVDLHTDGDDPARLARFAAMAGGLRSGVALGPCAGMARMPRSVAARVAEQLAAADVTVVCLPQGDCTGLERYGSRVSRPAPVRLLRAAGVRVAAGSGALRDVANPVGRGDPLEAAYLLASLGRGHAGGRVRGGEFGRRGRRWACRRYASRRASPPSCWRYAANASPGCSRSPTAGSWCTGGGLSPAPARCGSTATRRRRWRWSCPGSRSAEPGRPAGVAVAGGWQPGRTGRSRAARVRFGVRSGSCALSSQVDMVRSRFGWSGCSPSAGTRSRASSAGRSRPATCWPRAPNRWSATWSRRRWRMSRGICRRRTRPSSPRARGRAAASSARTAWTAAPRRCSPTRPRRRVYAASSSSRPWARTASPRRAPIRSSRPTCARRARRTRTYGPAPAWTGRFCGRAG